MNKIAIMQPYIFPYLGYFQLVSEVDTFVLYDDVNFIKKGWINRNNILLNGRKYLFTMPCHKISQNKLICETEINQDQKQFDKILDSFYHAYKKAPNFNRIITLIEECIYPLPDFINQLAGKSVIKISEYLNLQTVIVSSSSRYNNESLERADRLIDICKKEVSNDYINAQGGQQIYSKKYFEQSGVNLRFLQPTLKPYQQFSDEFVPGLSIIDALMFNDKKSIKDYLLVGYNLT